MVSVPVCTTIKPHVEAHEQDRIGTKLNRQIKRLKSGVAAVARDPRRQHELIKPAAHIDPMKIGIQRRGLRILCNFQAGKLRDAVAMLPPRAVTAIEKIGERREAEAFVDRNDAGAAVYFFDVRLRG